MRVRLKPCVKNEDIHHRACTSDGCLCFLYRAQPAREMKHGVRNRAARREPDGGSAQPAREMKHGVRNRAARREPDGEECAASKIFSGFIITKIVLFYFYLMRNAFSRIHPYVDSLLFFEPVFSGQISFRYKGKTEVMPLPE